MRNEWSGSVTSFPEIPSRVLFSNDFDSLYNLLGSNKCQIKMGLFFKMAALNLFYYIDCFWSSLIYLVIILFINEKF